MTDILSKALARRVELRAELAEIESFIDLHKRIAARLSSVPSSESIAPPRRGLLNGATSNESEQIENQGNLLSPTRPTPTTAIHNAAVEIIRAAGRPVPLGEMVHALWERRMIIGGKDPAANLSAKLGHCDLLVSIRNVGWWLKHQDFPPAHYRSPAAQAEIDEILS